MHRFPPLLLAAMLALPAAVDAADPSAYEQFQLELINRARLDPLAEAQLLGVALDQGLPAGTISPDPKPPLAFHELLIDAAVGHTDWMLATDTFGHTGAGGSTYWDRIEDAGYTWATNAKENAGWAGSILPLTEADVLSHLQLLHAAFFESPDHRRNLMNPVLREVGIGTSTGPFAPSGMTYNAVVTTHDFARPSGGGGLLTGVVFDDVDEDDFYTPGEGLGGIVLSARRRSDGATWYTSTWASGGYTLELSAGSYDVTASGSGFGSQSLVDVGIGAENLKVDFYVPEPPGSLQLGAGLLAVLALGRSRARALRATEPR